MNPSQLIDAILDGIEDGQKKNPPPGAESLDTIVDDGYRGEVPRALLDLYEGSQDAARRAIQRLAYDRVEKNLKAKLDRWANS